MSISHLDISNAGKSVEPSCQITRNCLSFCSTVQSMSQIPPNGRMISLGGCE